MRDLVSQTVTEAVSKKGGLPASGPPQASGVSSEDKKFFEEKIEQFESEFREKEQEISALRMEKKVVADNEKRSQEEL